jgi:hypothetical protein
MKHTASPPPTALSNASPLAPPPLRSIRSDGWTMERRRRFCEVLAETGRVQVAAKAVGMDVSSAYRLRRRRDAREFALAWTAALSLAQARMIDEAMELALDGTYETITRDDGTIIERRRKDSNLMLTTLAKLNQLDAFNERGAQIVAQDFDAFLDRMDGTEMFPDETLDDFLNDRSGKRSISGRLIKPAGRDKDGRFLPKSPR